MNLITVAQAMKLAGRSGPSSLAQQDEFLTKYGLVVEGTMNVKGKDARVIDRDRLVEALKAPKNTKTESELIKLERQLIEMQQILVNLVKIVDENGKALNALIRLQNLQSGRLDELVKMWKT